jgi:hypothetical protein
MNQRRLMMNRFVKALSVAIGAAVMLGSSAMQAAGHRSDPVEIPFDFTVQGQQLPAGAYRLQRGASDRVTALVNVRTGKQVQILRSLGNEPGKTRLVFERQGDGYVLRKLS